MIDVLFALAFVFFFCFFFLRISQPKIEKREERRLMSIVYKSGNCTREPWLLLYMEERQKKERTDGRISALALAWDYKDIWRRRLLFAYIIGYLLRRYRPYHPAYSIWIKDVPFFFPLPMNGVTIHGLSQDVPIASRSSISGFFYLVQGHRYLPTSIYKGHKRIHHHRQHDETADT